MKRFTWEFRQADITENIRTKGIQGFLSWPVSAESLYSADWNTAMRCLKALPVHLASKCYAFNTGCPPMAEPTISLNDNLLDPHLLLQAIHLNQLILDHISFSPSDTIYEFGGGFGSMALLLHRLGFRGRYIIQDLPELIQLQSYFLTQEGVTNVEYTTETLPGAYTTFIANCSLSEVSPDLRESVFNAIDAQYYEICYQPSWDNINVAEHLAQLSSDKTHILWHDFPSLTCPHHCYLIGETI
jgi:hypothetical protein